MESKLLELQNVVKNECVGFNMSILTTYNTTNCQSDKENTHSYISQFYDPQVGSMKNENINILEIGIQYGYSLKLWEDYFTEANIYGIDISNQLKVSYGPRVHTKFLNAYTNEALEYLKNLNVKFDIIIDDGPHVIETQDYVCKNYKQFLNDNGLLVVEDCHVNTYEVLRQRNPEFISLNLLDIAPAWGDSIILYYKKGK
jgi:hypothetical protein